MQESVFQNIQFPSTKTQAHASAPVFESDLSENKYLKESIFSFPSAAADPSCSHLRNGSRSNLETLYSESIDDISNGRN
jgi:hypothetical protein